jgi:hypothetical protein
MNESLNDLAKYKSIGAKPVVEVESEDWEESIYPKPDKQYASNQKYTTYDSISTGVGGKKK